MIRALTRNRAETAADATDPALRGRTYAIPFAEVWERARVVATRLGWDVVEADEQEGRIRAEDRSRVFRFLDDVEVRVSLDAEGQTRVDMWSSSRVGRADLGVNRRRIRRFMRRLDEDLEPDHG